MGNQRHIKSPEEVTDLLEGLWLRHKAGFKKTGNNEFWVDIPPLTEEEKAAIQAKKDAEQRAAKEKDDKPEDLFGSWV